MHTMIVLFLLTAVSVHSDEPILLADSLSSYSYPGFVLLGTGEVLFIDASGDLCRVDIDEPLQVEQLTGLTDAGEAGWANPGQLSLLRLSPDGSRIFYGQQVFVPDSLQDPERNVLGPVCLFTAEPDGSGGRIIALSFLVGCGPQFDFSEDSRFIYGYPLLNCAPHPEEYLAYWRAQFWGDGEVDPLYDGYLIDLDTGGRSGGVDTLISDGYYPNPRSDLVAAGCYPPGIIADAITGEILLNVPGSHGAIESWVLPDAGLAGTDSVQVLRYADGRVTVNCGEEIVVYAWLAEGRYLFGPGDYDTVFIGDIDWDTFTAVDPLRLSIGVPAYCGSAACLTSDGTSLVYESGDRLYRIDLP